MLRRIVKGKKTICGKDQYLEDLCTYARHTQVTNMHQSSNPTPAMLNLAHNRMATNTKEIAHPAIYVAASCDPLSTSG
jgi:hypothetical protein